MRGKKILLIGFRLNKGGAERVMATLSTYLSNQGLEVHIVILEDEIAYPHKGQVLNLGKLKTKRNGLFNKFRRFWQLRKYLRANQFDFIIDFRFRIKPLQEIIINNFAFNQNTIYTVHSSTLHEYLLRNRFFSNRIYRDAYKVVAITKAMQKMIETEFDFDNVTTIYNPIDLEFIRREVHEPIDLDFKYIIGSGHFNTDQKQFDKLIYAYSKSILKQENVHLVILGEGGKKKSLEAIAIENNVDKYVHFLGFKENPYKYYKNAEFFVLTSKFEGLPMVLLEALASGVPAVTFNCPTGPFEVITNEENGLLITDQDMNELVAGINKMFQDKMLYVRCKNNAQKSVEKFSIENIGKQWLSLMDLK